ncbi:ribbon-helix-helix protein, CopG family [Crocosphaera watsonii]|nr:ribbon-helix-helix protein, CopG family [Crocosphaera watsonii]
MSGIAMLKDYRVDAGSWGESKRRVNLMLTPTAVEKVDKIAEQMRLTRSEVLERLIRTECLDLDLLSKISGNISEQKNSR